MLASTAFFMQQFRWRSSTKSGQSYYVAWETLKADLGTNYWELANMFNNYAGLAIFGVAFLTQAISFFGILNDINVMVWTYGVGMGGTILGVAYNLLIMLGLISLYSKNQDSGNANKTSHGNLMI